jgi:hypothetical protein
VIAGGVSRRIYSEGVLNRKFADLRHAPELDPMVLHYHPAALPQAVVAIGRRGRRKTKGGLVLADPGFSLAAEGEHARQGG